MSLQWAQHVNGALICKHVLVVSLCMLRDGGAQLVPATDNAQRHRMLTIHVDVAAVAVALLPPLSLERVNACDNPDNACNNEGAGPATCADILDNQANTAAGRTCTCDNANFVYSNDDVGCVGARTTACHAAERALECGGGGPSAWAA